MSFEGTTALGQTGIRTSRLGLSSGYAAGEDSVLHAFERGVRYFYWGSTRGDAFGRGLAHVARAHRAELTVVVQSYTRAAFMMRGSLERALRALKLEYTDALLLGWWNRVPPRRIVDAALAIREAGLARTLMISSHDRTKFPELARDPAFGAIMVRYSAAHPGAEREVFPHIASEGSRRVGVVSYTATRWGALLDPRFTPAGERTPRAPDCYRFALTNRHVDVCLMGPRTRAELEEGLTALDQGAMTSDEIAWMKRVGTHVREAARGQPKSFAMNMIDRLFAV